MSNYGAGLPKPQPSTEYETRHIVTASTMDALMDMEPTCWETCRYTCTVCAIFEYAYMYTFGLLGRGFTALREMMYFDPDSINFGERGRTKWIEIWNCFPCCNISRSRELRFQLLLGSFSSVYDWSIDILLLVKWLGGWDVLGPLKDRNFDELHTPYDYPKREWEAYLLITFIAMGNLAAVFLGTRTRGRGCTWRFIFHAIGLGAFIEHFSAWNDEHRPNMMQDVNPFNWSEIIFEKGPGALVVLYVGLQDGTESGSLFSLETLMIISSCTSIASGFGAIVTGAGKQKDVKLGGDRGWLRKGVAIALMMFDVIFRYMLFVMWLNYLPDFLLSKGIQIDQWFAFILIFCTFFSLEIIYQLLNRKYLGNFWVLMLFSYVGVFNGSLLYFSRRWRSSAVRSLDTKHYRTRRVFWLRYFVQWGFFAALYFYVAECTLDHPGDCMITGAWFWTTAIAGLALPFFFFLKPPSPPIHYISEWAFEQDQKFEANRKAWKKSRKPSLEMIQTQTNEVGGGSKLTVPGTHTTQVSYDYPKPKDAHVVQVSGHDGMQPIF